MVTPVGIKDKLHLKPYPNSYIPEDNIYQQDLHDPVGNSRLQVDLDYAIKGTRT
jgi:hypothetical protein